MDRPTDPSPQSPQTADRLTTLVHGLAAHGHRLTAARRAILDALVRSDGHISADVLAERVAAVSPGIGRMTVYRTLELLSALGLIRPVYQGTGAAHFILMEQGHHHHLVCSLCHKVIEFDACAVGELETALGRQYDFLIQGHFLELFGRCQECRRSGREESRAT
jgi:Fur family ferric uptake transcriptional regulator